MKKVENFLLFSKYKKKKREIKIIRLILGSEQHE